MTKHLLFRCVVVVLCLLVSSVGWSQPVLQRVAATSLQLPTTAPATSYTTAPAFPNLSFTFPVALVTPPGETRRLFVVEKTGRIWVITDVTAASPTRTLFLDLTAQIATSPSNSNDERGLLALAFHPQYATNGRFFVWYTLNSTTSAGTGLHDRLSRFRVSSTDANVGDPSSEQPLISQYDEAANHNGGQLMFGPDGFLYLSLGDEGNANDSLQNSQRIDRDFFSGLLRLDVDRRAGSLAPNAHPAVHSGTYAIPAGNPFVGATSFNGTPINTAALRTEFWATGLRNPWRFAFDSSTGDLWCADVGQAGREEINVITAGANYGWNHREGTLAGPRGSALPAATFTGPVWEYAHSAGLSVTGGILYRGALHANLLGKYLFCDYLTGAIWSLEPDSDHPAAPVNADRVQLLTTDAGISSFGMNPATGDILLADLPEGTIKRLVANPAPGTLPLPATLSATGAFADLANLTPAPGLVAYEPNVSFWSDHASKRRWFLLRDLTSRYGFSNTSSWSFPTGATWVKHFDLELTRGDASTTRRIETRFLIKTLSGVYGVTYRWNDAQTDAALVPDEGSEQTFSISENGTVRPQIWRFPSRAECLTCHTKEGGFALSFNTRQLNRVHDFPDGRANIITALADAGYLEAAPANTGSLPALANATDLSRSLEDRARSYLDANCVQCHQPGGPALGHWDARATTPLSLASIINAELIDVGESSANRLIVPGDPAHTRLLHRIAGSHGATRMPPLATRERDLGAETLINQWILSLAQPATTGSRLINLSTRAQALSGSATLISGFVVKDGARPLLVRAAGPALSSMGVSNPLPQPSLTLYRGSESIAANVGWSNSANAAAIRAAAQTVGAFPFGDTSADSALLTTLEPGVYTAHVTSVNGSSGVVLAELYDAGPSQSGESRLVNTSLRAMVGTGDNLLIAGLVVGAGASKTVLIRAIGPGLASQGVADALGAPVVTLYSGAQSIASNTRWNTAPNAGSIRTSATQVGAFALTEGSADCAILTMLSAGAYTIHIRGANDTTGVALVEVYEVPN